MEREEVRKGREEAEKAPKKYRVLLLDVDGTLLDFHASERQGISRILLDYGFPASDELLEKYHRINDGYWQAFNRGEISKDKLCRERFTRFFGELGLSTDGEEEERRYQAFLDESAILLPGALETCRKLSEQYDCYVVTNGTSQTQYRRLALSGLDVLMKDIFVSEDAGSQKPQKAYFDYCFSRIPGALPEEMLIVGDSLSSDILGGNQAGIDTCWVNPEGLPLQEGIRADYQIREIGELPALLQKARPRSADG